jgi:hypothetical protein
MAAHIVILSVALLLCLVGFIFVFEIQEGNLSSVTGPSKRRLTALWVLSSLELAFLFIWYLARNRFTWNPELTPALIGLILSVVGFLVVNRLAGTAADEGHAALSKLTRWSQLLFFLAVSGCLLYLLLRLPEPQAGTPRILGLTLVILTVSVAMAALVYFFVKDKPDSLANDDDPMPAITRRVLAFYLLLFGICLLTLLWRIGSIEFPNAGLKIETNIQIPPATTAAAPPTSSGNEGTASKEKHPALYQLLPQTTLGAAPIVYITAYGENFTPESKLRFNQQTQPTVFVDASRIQAQLDRATIDSMDPISVDVITKDQVTVPIAMTIKREHATDELLGLHLDLTRDLQLLLLAMLAGALGSFVHALKSFGDFVGNRTLTTSWFWWYITRPFLGAALAVIFYAVLRGGFMAGTPADAKSVSQFGVIAIGALVGMFADKASDKLAEIFDTLFKGADNRSGKLAAPIIDKLDPEMIASGSDAIDLRLIGDRLGTVKQVKFDNAVHPLGIVTEKQITVPLTKDELTSPRTIKVSVLGDNGESPTKDLQIT